MAPTGSGSKIVRQWTPHDAPTGVTYYQTADGTVWKSTPYRDVSRPTGVDHGFLQGDVIRRSQ